jgi:hypothetical protein
MVHDRRRALYNSLLLAERLQLNILVVVASSLQQLVVRAGFTYPTFLDEVSVRRKVSNVFPLLRRDSHPIRVLNRRKSVSNSNRGTSLCRSV